MPASAVIHCILINFFGKINYLKKFYIFRFSGEIETKNFYFCFIKLKISMRPGLDTQLLF